ncbi:hypothetical protein RFI_02069 [Reticulomyxa filosa]|uniref:Uncharacterized protein n=1 Tax=Reticulomyxa filosa TaxID=46433 RepID=X6PAB9_RETFI|nr:hypothetical protein RFI_02069 [Reticulomyxa filosa]|eukprot:ETO35004.1 hypothetical protein RFI_02069 [Reticulomyxa filosa]
MYMCVCYAHMKDFLLTENDPKPATKQPSPGVPVWIPQYKAYGHVGLYSLVDRMVIARTNCLLDYYYGTKARIHPTKWLVPSFFFAWFVTLMMLMLNLLLKFSVTRSLLGLMRKFFIKPGHGPSEEQMQQAKAEFRVIATSKNTKKAVEVSFLVTGDAGYLHTSKFLVEHGLFMADQRKGALRTRKGGFFTPAGLAKDAVLKKFSEEKDFKLTIKDL